MKKNKITLMAISALLTLIAVFATSCEKEEFTEPKEKTDNYSANIKIVDGILFFKTEKDFISTYNYFEKNNSIQKEYKDFKSQYQYTSLYEKCQKEEELWLNNYELDLKSDPNDKYISDDIYKMFINNEGLIVIENIIYKFEGPEVVYKINNLNWKSLEQINQNPTDFWGNTNIKDVILLNYNPDKGECKQNVSKSGSSNYQSDRLVKWKASVINAPFVTRVKAETKSYKRKGFRWVAYNTTVKAKIYDFTLYNTHENGYYQCTHNGIGTDKDGDTEIRYNDNKVECRIGNGCIPFWVKKNTIKMYFYCNGWSKTYTLNW